MSLSEDVDLEELIMTKDDLSGADIKAVCSESSSQDVTPPTHMLIVILTSLNS
jgi:ATP-dependent 26S proteasome regulatory subunit